MRIVREWLLPKLARIETIKVSVTAQIDVETSGSWERKTEHPVTVESESLEISLGQVQQPERAKKKLDLGSLVWIRSYKPRVTGLGVAPASMSCDDVDDMVLSAVSGRT